MRLMRIRNGCASTGVYKWLKNRSDTRRSDRNKLFPDTTPAEVLAMFGALPEEVAVLRKSSDKIIRLQQSISIPISKKSMSKTERDKKIVDMYNNGYSIRDIWKESGVQSKSTVYSILNKYKVQLNRTPGRVPGIRK